MDPRQLRASIVINTFNRAGYLRRLLAGLAHLRDAEFEVVVVNGPSNDGTAQLLAQYEGRIKSLQCPSRNLSESRNIGIAAAAGEIVIFIDDDALPGDSAWLARYIQAFQSDVSGKIGGLGGSVFHRDTAYYEFNGGLSSDYGFHIFDAGSNEQQKLANQRWVNGVRGCNCAFRRTALAQIGGFDEFYTYYLDETDVCMRLLSAGFDISRLSDNPVRHYSAPSQVRANQFDRDWHVITRSDTYYALKNGGDRLLRRIAKTLAAAPRKHYVGEINSYVRTGQISPAHWARLMKKWGTGLASGLKAGLTQRRRTAILDKPSAPFLPFSLPSIVRPLRVALLSQNIPGQPSYGGVGRYTFDLAQGLHERGHEVHIICKDEQPLRTESLGFYIHGIPSSSYLVPTASDRPILQKNLAYSAAIVRKLEDLYVQGVEFDVVHASNWDAEAAALVRAQVYPTVLMLVSPLAQVIVTENWLINDDLRACVGLDKWQISSADTVCVPSDGVLVSYESLMGIVPSSIRRLRRAPLGIVPDALPAKEPAKKPRKLLFVGRCERRKGAHNLLDVLPDLLTGFPDWECHLVGNDTIATAEGDTLKERFLDSHRGAPWLGRVKFHGSVVEQELRYQYETCDLFVAPSLFESFGLIYHEAMQYGTAVVGCHTGGVPEVVAHGVEGLLVQPDSPSDLRDALAQLMASDDLRQQMGRAGARRVREETNYRTMAQRLEQIYYETCTDHGVTCRERRRQSWHRVLQLFEPDPHVRFTGEWVTQEAVQGFWYRLGKPGATVSFSAESGATLRIVALRHPWSGILEVRVGTEHFSYIDLYHSGELQKAAVHELLLPQLDDEFIDVTLRVHEERNPASQMAQAYLKQISIVAEPQPEHHAPVV